MAECQKQNKHLIRFHGMEKKLTRKIEQKMAWQAPIETPNIPAVVVTKNGLLSACSQSNQILSFGDLKNRPGCFPGFSAMFDGLMLFCKTTAKPVRYFTIRHLPPAKQEES